MGNENEKKKGKDIYYMKITLIGSDISTFNDILQKSEQLKTIKTCWEIELIKNEDITKQLTDYFDRLKQIKEKNLSEDLRECLVFKINNSFDPEMNIILDCMNELSGTHFLPLVLILTKEESNSAIEIDNEKYTFDPRLIFVRNYTENQYQFEEIIAPVFLRFCSIHNELGDEFDMSGIGKNEKYDLIEKGFPFYLNLACIGRFGQGKSTGINAILQEYKAKESSKGSAQTKKITYYVSKNRPIKILDVPGFESQETVTEAIKKFKIYGEAINKMKDNLHIILYFLNMDEKRAFQDLEYPMIEEIIKHKSTRVIYVITNSNPKIKDNKKKQVYDRINTGLDGITKNKPIQGKIQMLKADQNNVVFVNFHKYEICDDIVIEQFGKKELFKKIHEFFTNSRDYKEKKERFNEEKLEESLKSLRIKAQQILFTNKIWGAAVGLLPFFTDMPLRHFIKKNAIKKVGELYGINIDFINEQKEKEKENKKKKTENETSFITPDLDIEYLNTTIKGDGLIEETPKEKINDKITETGIIGSYLGGTASVGYGMNLSSEFIKIQAEALELAAKAKRAQEALDAANAVNNTVQNVGCFGKAWNFISGAGKAANLAVQKASELAEIASQESAIATQKLAETSTGTFWKVAGTGLGVIGVVSGVAIGGYFTHKFCEELLDKFEGYFRNNVGKIRNSFEDAAKYFLIDEYNQKFY